MKKTEIDIETAELAKELENDLLDRYGPMVTGKDLSKLLGYPTQAAMRQSYSVGAVPISLFNIEKRRGKFALVKDIALWMAQKRMEANIK